MLKKVTVLLGDTYRSFRFPIENFVTFTNKIIKIDTSAAIYALSQF
jgi:hypothetical protein